MRLFVALELPEGVREALAGWGRVCARRDPALRPVTGDALHLTLAFLGERPEDEVESLRWALAALAPLEPVPLGLGEGLWLAPRRPHVLACAIEDPTGALAALHARVVAAMAESSGWKPERRPLIAHVTVCRVRRGRNPRTAGIARLGGADAREFDPPALALLESELGSGPPRYTVLERVAVQPQG